MALFRCSNAQKKADFGTITWGTSDVKITLGYQPKYVAVVSDATKPAIIIYNEDRSSTQYAYGGGTTTSTMRNLPTTYNGELRSIDSDGFTLSGRGSGSETGYYFAMA